MRVELPFIYVFCYGVSKTESKTFRHARKCLWSISCMSRANNRCWMLFAHFLLSKFIEQVQIHIAPAYLASFCQSPPTFFFSMGPEYYKRGTTLKTKVDYIVMLRSIKGSHAKLKLTLSFFVNNPENRRYNSRM